MIETKEILANPSVNLNTQIATMLQLSNKLLNMLFTPLVSLITPSYNQGQFLEQTIHSVIKQDYPKIEYLVIDGGSTDQSIEIIQKYGSRITYWVSEPDKGQAEAINKGLALAKGEIIGWLNADDMLLPGTIQLAVETFQKNPEVDVFYGHLERIDDNGQLVPTPTLPKDRVTFSKQLVIGECLVNQPGSFWRKEIMDRVGLLNPDLHYVLDYEYWIRLALEGAIFHRVSNTVAYFRLSHSSKTVIQTAQMAREQLEILERTLHLEGLPVKTGLSQQQIDQQARHAKSRICLHASYGSLKKQKWGQAIHWLWLGMKHDPFVMFERRWFTLAYAGMIRRLRNSLNIRVNKPC